MPSHHAHHTLCDDMGTSEAKEISVSRPTPPHTLKAVQTQPPCSLPSLDDGDDVIHLDVQLVWFFKVLKGPHVRGLGLRAQKGHCPPWGRPRSHPRGPVGRRALTSSRKSRRATKLGLSSGL